MTSPQKQQAREFWIDRTGIAFSNKEDAFQTGLIESDLTHVREVSEQRDQAIEQLVEAARRAMLRYHNQNGDYLAMENLGLALKVWEKLK